VFPSPKINLSVGVQTASRAPFVFVFSGVQSEEKHEGTQGFLDVRLSQTHEDVFGQPAGTFGTHRGARSKTLSHQQEPERLRR